MNAATTSQLHSQMKAVERLLKPGSVCHFSPSFMPTQARQKYQIKNPQKCKCENAAAASWRFLPETQ